MNLSAYLKRIQFDGEVRPDLATLNVLINAHVRSVPFENLDIYAERSVVYSTEAAYDQIVTRGQGGWCFEMNSLFGWVLNEIGFNVARLSAGVRRTTLGDASLGNHLCLMVTLDQDYLVDVGFGGSQLAAIALEIGETIHSPLRMAMAQTEDGYWRLHEGGWGSAMCYDFKAEPADDALLVKQHNTQVDDPNSIFRKTVTAKIRTGRAYHTLRGRVLDTNWPGRKETREIASAEEWSSILNDVFGLHEPEIDRLWPMICARHKQLFPLS